MDTINPHPVHAGQHFNVRIARQKLCLEAPHLAGGRGLSLDGLAADNPPHGRISSETHRVVHVFITAKASKHRLTELTCHAVPSVLTGTVVLEDIPDNIAQAKCVIKLSIGEQAGVSRDLGTVKFQL